MTTYKSLSELLEKVDTSNMSDSEKYSLIAQIENTESLTKRFLAPIKNTLLRLKKIITPQATKQV